jgi:hypothetical protein
MIPLWGFEVSGSLAEKHETTDEAMKKVSSHYQLPKGLPHPK